MILVLRCFKMCLKIKTHGDGISVALFSTTNSATITNETVVNYKIMISFYVIESLYNHKKILARFVIAQGQHCNQTARMFHLCIDFAFTLRIEDLLQPTGIVHLSLRVTSKLEQMKSCHFNKRGIFPF